MIASFKKAVKTQAKGRLGIIGPSGSGKTYTALAVGQHLGEKMAVIDTEHGSASLYADWCQFDTLILDNFTPQNYIDAIHTAGAAGYDVLVIDSLTHAWAGPGGALEMADRNMAKYSGNKWAAWRDVSPLHNQLIEAMLSYPGHLIGTMRSKMEYIQTEDDKGKKVIRKVGMAPIQREGMEYEFGIVGEMDLDHNFSVTKTRCSLFDGLFINKPGKEFADKFIGWLTDGAPVQLPPVPAVAKAPEQQKPAAPSGTPAASANAAKPVEPPPAAAPMTNGVDSPPSAKDWTAFWMACREIGMGKDPVHNEAAPYFGIVGLKSLSDDVPELTAAKLQAFGKHLRALVGQKSA